MEMIREFYSMTDRYAYDFGKCSYKNGFAQVDTSQDASYYGTWANPETLIIVSYCEGDVTIKTADTVEEFVEELKAIKKWNDDNGYRFLGIDPGCGKALKARFQAIGLGELLH